MHHRVDNCFEDCALAELRHVSAGRVLVRGHAPVADHEEHGAAYLPVERTRDVLRVELLAGVHPETAIADSLNPGVRQPFSRIVRRQQHTSDGGPERAVSVVLEELQLRQRHLGGLIRSRARVAPPQLRPQAVDAAAPHHLRIGGGDVRLPPRLRQPADLCRVHLALLVSPATEMPARRPMDRRALRHLDHQRAPARRPRRRHPEQTEVQRRLQPLPVLGVVHGVREAFHGLCIATGLQFWRL